MALLWSGEIDIKIRSLGQRLIDFEVKEGLGEYWRRTGIYGWSEARGVNGELRI